MFSKNQNRQVLFTQTRVNSNNDLPHIIHGFESQDCQKLLEISNTAQVGWASKEPILHLSPLSFRLHIRTNASSTLSVLGHKQRGPGAELVRREFYLPSGAIHLQPHKFVKLHQICLLVQHLEGSSSSSSFSLSFSSY